MSFSFMLKKLHTRKKRSLSIEKESDKREINLGHSYHVRRTLHVEKLGKKKKTR